MLVEHDAYSKGDALAPDLVQYFNIPQHLFSDTYRKSNGFFYFKESLNEKGELENLYTQSRFLVKRIDHSTPTGYQWSEMTFFSRWTPQNSTILCMGVPSSFASSLASILPTIWDEDSASNAYAAHVPLVETLIAMHDESVWGFRDEVRNIEKARMPSVSNTLSFTSMHDTARHAIHSVETLGISVKTLEAMSTHISALSQAGTPHHDHQIPPRNKVQIHITSQTLMLKNFLARSESNEKRLQNEISLVYNMIAQRDSKTMTLISESAKLDSSDMRAIALVTMAFLPPTFISAVFSTSFFNYEPAGESSTATWSVSSEFWIYWVFAIPLTCLTMAFWMFWERGRNKVWSKGREIRGLGKLRR
ncbi:hypothetical protein DM02DRAFT_177767 [Periconia macrospinosa]|uniref:Uncharacterized protein n=1 Tax=Periconia macrospinosa TaxID=97972 RepID=A0A2V1E5D9_9PLEO|nr:hypothetical protein DM02DRAFT_177767 [Periconia macrospinosa]